MKNGPGGTAIRQIGRLFDGESVTGLGESQLLERFVSRRDGLAFAALVARHGPMVQGICRRVLDDPHDVEDAFQATFLVLVRRAGSIRDRERLASWLFGVARKVANRARLDRSRRRLREGQGVELVADFPSRDEQRAELGRALIEEIERLPDSLRMPVILCCVEGLAYAEAASRLGATEPAIRGRLSRARERLQGRLSRRGFAPASGALAALFSAEMASAAVSPTLMTSTTRAAIGFAAGRAATTGAVPIAVAGLAEGVIRTMILTKSKLAAAALIACGIVGSSVGVLGQHPAPAANPSPAPAATIDPAKPNPPDRLDGLEKKLDRLIEVLTNPRPATAPPAPPDAPPVSDRGVVNRRPPVAEDGPDAGIDVARVRRRANPLEAALLPPPGLARRGRDAGPPSDVAHRVEVLERKLASLEERLGALEGRLRAPSTPPGPAVRSRTPMRPGFPRSRDARPPAPREKDSEASQDTRPDDVFEAKADDEFFEPEAPEEAPTADRTHLQPN